MSQNIKDTIRRYVVGKLLGGDARDLEDNTDLLAAGLINSFSALELVAFLERTFQVEIGLGQVTATNLQSIEALTRLVQSAGVRQP